MAEKCCEWCGRLFTPREAKQRFCCRAHSITFYDEERRAAVAAWRERQAEQPEEAQA
jgi:hypothetical protein